MTTATRGTLSTSLVPCTNVQHLLLAGSVILAVGLGGMGAWAALAPLHHAVIAPGVLVPETGRKTIKHVDGGIIGEILVNEGDAVRAGAVLLRLDQTQADARLEVLSADHLDSLALEARLTAELQEQERIDWPAQLLARIEGPAVARMMHNQQTLFAVRRTQMQTTERLIHERVASLRQEASSLEAQRRFLSDEIGLNRQELGMAQALLSRGHTAKLKVMDLQKEESRLQVRDQELAARIAQIGQQAVEAEGDLNTRKNDYREKVLVELEKARSEVKRLAEEIRDATNKLANRDIRAPEDGSVVGLRHLAVGGVITANEAILDLVPNEQALLAEAHITPQDIEAVSVGMPALLTLTAYDTRSIGSLEGTVEHVSADRLTDPATQQSYYLTRVRLKDATAHQVNNLRIIPGMPIEAHILVAARTPLDYILSPITRSYNKSFVQR